MQRERERERERERAFSDHRIMLVCVYTAVFFRDQPFREMRYGRSDRIIASQLTSVGVGIRLILSRRRGRTFCLRGKNSDAVRFLRSAFTFTRLSRAFK